MGDVEELIGRLRDLGIRSADLAADALTSLQVRLNRTLQDHGRMLWREDIEAHCPNFDLCSEYADNGLRCSPCAIKQSEAAGVQVLNFGKPYSPEEWRLKRQIDALQARLAAVEAERDAAREALEDVADYGDLAAVRIARNALGKPHD